MSIQNPRTSVPWWGELNTEEQKVFMKECGFSSPKRAKLIFNAAVRVMNVTVEEDAELGTNALGELALKIQTLTNQVSGQQQQINIINGRLAQQQVEPTRFKDLELSEQDALKIVNALREELGFPQCVPTNGHVAGNGNSREQELSVSAR